MHIAQIIIAIIEGTVETLRALQAVSKALRDAQAEGKEDISDSAKADLEKMYTESRSRMDAAIQRALAREKAAEAQSDLFNEE